ncbi:hypothetical protein [Cupriavidus sp. TMH.W2]|uniref:ADP-ribosyltransferase-containing protein n=1 Tax=Cupriavidus sp. TMH.W2 TaxID=3434465 RepID=UPI003D7760C8
MIANAPLLRAADGRPLRVYHGSPAGHFARFDRAFEGSNTGPASGTHALGGFYFSDHPETANTYARTHEVELAHSAEQKFGIVPREALPQSTIYASYLRMARPLHLLGYPNPSHIADARAAGHDGVIARVGEHHEYVVFHPDQIMSIFDPEVAAAHVQRVPGLEAFAPVDTRSEAFRAWFRNSALVDETGRPQVLFHGSQADFSVFSDSHIGTGVDAVSNLGDWGDGFYLTNDPELASVFAQREGETDGTGAVVLPLYVSMQNPIRAEDLYDMEGVQGMLADPYPGDSLRKMLEAVGYDGILVKGGREVVVFRPNQIKSAISNRGEFSLADPDIRFARTAARALPAPATQVAPAQEAAGVYRLFHGSRARFTTIAPSARGFYGAGIYLTDEEATAWEYAEDANGAGSPVVYAAEVRMQRPFVFEAPEAMEEPTSDTLAKHLLAGPALTSALRTLLKHGEIGSVLQEELVRWGYDGLIVRVPDTPTEYIAFQSKQVTVQPIQTEAAARDPATSAFADWFAGSVATEADGRPRTLYHGTTESFARFDPARSGTQSNTGAPHGTFFFSESPAIASSYTVEWQGDFSVDYREGGNVIPAHLQLRKPLKVSAKGESWNDILYKGRFIDINELAALAKAAGRYDGVIVKRVRDRGTGAVEAPVSTTYIAFDASQIRNAITGELMGPEQLPLRFRRDASTTLDAEVPALDLAIADDAFSTLREARLGATAVSYGVRREGTALTLKVYALRTPRSQRGNGHARRAMQAVLQQADAAGMPVTLDASPLDNRTRLDRLTGFYQSLGFVPTGGSVNVLGHPVMDRAPQASHLDPEAHWRGRAFEAWFGASEIVDETGAPLPVYHGTAADVTAFDRRRLGEVTETSDAKLGFWFAGHPARANLAAEDAQAVTADDSGANVVRAFLRMERPYHDYGSLYETLSDPESTARTIRRARRAGHDGVIFYNGEGGTNFVVFEAGQIKSAIGNVGTFSRSSDDLRYRRDAGGSIRKPLRVALPCAVLDALQPLSEAQALAMVAGKTGKPHGVDPALHFDARFAEAKRNLYGLVPPSAFVANDAGERYDGTVDLARAHAYAAQPAGDVPPVIAVIGRRSGMLHIIDGGHRLSAARLRGDAQVPVIVRVPASAELVFEAELTEPAAPAAQAAPPVAPTADAIRAALAADEFGHHVDVYPTFAAIPPYVQAKARRDSNFGVRGYWDPRRNRVGLVADSHDTIEAAVKTARHELIGHFGVERMLGEARFQEVIAMVGEAERNGNPLIVRYAGEVDVAQPGLSAARRASEIIAHMAEDNVYDHGIMRRVWDGMRVFLRRIGFIKSDVTDARLCRLLRDSQRYVRWLRATPEPAPTHTPPHGSVVPVAPGGPEGWVPSQRFYGSVGADESNADLLRSLGVELGPYDYATGRFPARFTPEAKAALDTLTADFDVKAIAVHRGAEVGFFSPRHRNAEWLTQRRAVLDWQLTGDRPAPQRVRLQAERQAVDTALGELASPKAVSEIRPAAGDLAPA